MAELSKPKTYHNENGGEMEVHEVQERGEVTSYGGSVVPVREGTLVASTGRPGEYYVVDSLDGWTSGEAPEVTDSEDEEESAPDDDKFDPSAHSATEVREYLSRDDLSNEEYARIYNAEKAGKNRATAFPS